MADNIIPFPTLKESQVLREDMGKLEKDISSNLDKLQEINEEIVRFIFSNKKIKKIININEIIGILKKKELSNSESHFLFALISTNAFMNSFTRW